MKKLTTADEIMVWSQLRSSINTWVSVTASLLTSGTALFFLAFGVILSNYEKIGNGLTLLLTLGLFIGTIFVLISVWHISQAISRIVDACISIENSLFGKGENIHKITTIVNRHPLWGHRKPIGEYYRLWAFGLVTGAGLLTIWRLIIWLETL